MRSIFRSKYTVTQEFGVNSSYYGQFGLKGHEGIDLIPTGTVWDVLCLADGVVVLDDDTAGSVSSDPYGKIVTVWHQKLNKATMYCHLKENYVVNGQIVTQGEKLGLMGTTGNSTGPHLHLNLFETDDQGVRLNRNNGYVGGINPKPFLEEDAPVIDTTIQKELDSCKVDRDGHYNDKMALYEELGFTGVFNRTIAVEEIRKLKALEKSYIQKDEQLNKAQNEIIDLETALDSLKESHAQFAAESTKTIQDQGSEIQSLQMSISDLKSHVSIPITLPKTGFKRFLYNWLLKV